MFLDSLIVNGINAIRVTIMTTKAVFKLLFRNTYEIIKAATENAIPSP
jgi:hypothetical protein